MLKSLMVSENSLAFFLVLDLPLSRFSSLYKFSWNFSEIGYIIRLSKCCFLVFPARNSYKITLCFAFVNNFFHIFLPFFASCGVVF